jgi:hypothetical protein
METLAPKKTRTKAKPNITIEVVEVIDDSKKKGRKPKGGKLISKTDDVQSQQVQLLNVILHLKCSSKELNEYNEKGNKMTIDEFSYNPEKPPEIMTYNANNNYSVYDENKKLNNNAYAECNENGLCKVCNEKRGATNADADECNTSIKDINTKLKQLRVVLYKNASVENKSACFWCTYEYDNPTCYIPKYESEGSIYAYGSFCRPECAVAYLMKETMDDSTKFERYHLLNRIYGKIYGYSKNIKPAPNPYYTLEKYYGTLTIQEYRKLLKTDHMYLTIDKPITRLMPELHEETDETILNIGNSSNVSVKTVTGAYKVKRQSEKVAGPSKSNLMKSAFGIVQ